MTDPSDSAIPSPSRHEKHQPWLLSSRFSEFDELSEAIQGWDLDWYQLDGGSLSAELLQVGLGSALLTRVRFSRRFHQRGGTPSGMRSFGLIESGVSGVSWCGREIDESALLAFHPRGEFDAVSAPDFGCYTVSYPEEQLASVAEHLGLPDVEDLLGESEIVAINDPADMAELRGSLSRACDALSGGDGSPLPSERLGDLVQQMEFEIPGRILTALAGSSLNSRQPPARMRDLAIRRAESFIEATDLETLTVEEVCAAAGVSWRTLNYAFRERFGVTPKTYLKSVQLNAALTDLRLAPSGTKVADVANRCGFWHMGQFAADYRKQFGELPSATLRRALPS